ncbi:MAG: AraC family transcriptional regulator [Hespellia sp.]|nr:AraC family transcriptional regulator [Hespellia sp.]
MAYQGLSLNEDLVINKIFSIHYFEYFSDFAFPGESHDFWEFVCMDKGEVNVQADDKFYTLKKGDIIFHKPNEFHNVTANGTSAPNIVVASFQCDSPAMNFFENKILTIDDAERSLIAKIIAEAKRCIAPPFNNPYTQKLELLPEPYFGSQQMIKLYLEELLIHMIRSQYLQSPSVHPSKSIKKRNDDEAYLRITTYLEEHIREHVTLESICRDNLISRSQVQKLFREQNNCGVIDYFSQLKIHLAKQLIRENHHNFTQIAEFLGYTSIHYFSRQFKKIAGMTPSEYASSIKIYTEQ